MERVVITGMGINSCIGNTLETVTESLKAGRSGIRYNDVYAKLNFRSHVSATAEMDFENIDPELKKTYGRLRDVCLQLGTRCATTCRA